MNDFSILFIRKLVPCVSLNKINSVYLLKHLENVCEHIFQENKYNVKKPIKNCFSNVFLKKKGKKKKKITNSVISTERSNKIFRQVYQYFDKATVLLPELGPNGILRLLYALLKVKNFERNKAKKITVLKYIEYYILRSSINDEIFNFWKHFTINDAVLLFKMFIMNDYFSYDLLNTLTNKIIDNIKCSVPSDIVIFLSAYHTYKQKIKYKRYKIKEIFLTYNSLKILYNEVVNNFDLTNKEICNFIMFYSLYGKSISLDEKIMIYFKVVQHIEKTMLIYSPEQIKNLIISLFRIHNFTFDNTFNENIYKCYDKTLTNEILKKLFKLYNYRNIDVKIEDELNILDQSLKNKYYDYNSLEDMIFNIKNNISNLKNKNQIKYINLVIKLLNVYRNENNIHISSQKKFNYFMLRHILSESLSFFNLKYKFLPWNLMHIVLKYQLNDAKKILPYKYELKT
ncbi:conserved Plasmodium protein, unknown function [Plasmodium gallinaceum]|uniref:Uncharacterized protein n=1 Tax=Plasmodium gallinaceum TaxID=5849 RepID=A0A1J1H383_PLAGA|nr:conserved Plasmodium protein, unknown function [Plasmodium gallinaceum]CRG97949.1 conserved Plasmodium protein, unknown function [Plasmodium gallinaceum]